MKNNKILGIKIECYLNHWYPLYPFYIYTTIKFDLNDNIPIKDRLMIFLNQKELTILTKNLFTYSKKNML